MLYHHPEHCLQRNYAVHVVIFIDAGGIKLCQGYLTPSNFLSFYLFPLVHLLCCICGLLLRRVHCINYISFPNYFSSFKFSLPRSNPLQMEFTLLSQINLTRHNWRIKVRASRVRPVSGTSKWKGFNTMEFILVDEEVQCLRVYYFVLLYIYICASVLFVLQGFTCIGARHYGFSWSEGSQQIFKDHSGRAFLFYKEFPCQLNGKEVQICTRPIHHLFYIMDHCSRDTC
jgi:hypothetical protein